MFSFPTVSGEHLTRCTQNSRVYRYQHRWVVTCQLGQLDQRRITFTKLHLFYRQWQQFLEHHTYVVVEQPSFQLQKLYGSRLDMPIHIGTELTVSSSGWVLIITNVWIRAELKPQECPGLQDLCLASSKYQLQMPLLLIE